jgi:hypothetical protein
MASIFLQTLYYVASYLLLTGHAVADLVIFEPGLIANSSDAAAAGTLSQECIDAMQATITCDLYLRTQVMADTFGYLPTSVRDGLCTSACGQSLASYHASVQEACANDPQPWQGTPAVLYGDQIWAQYNITCFKDSNGNYCQGRRPFQHFRSIG